VSALHLVTGVGLVLLLVCALCVRLSEELSVVSSPLFRAWVVRPHHKQNHNRRKQHKVENRSASPRASLDSPCEQREVKRQDN